MFCEIKIKEDFERIYPILEEAFPITELREKKDQEALLQEDCYRLYGMKNQEGRFFAVVAMWDVAEDFIFIEHFAVEKKSRNGGIGGKMLDDFIAWYGKKVVLEVELPEDDLKKRRIAFYKRHGFAWNDESYFQMPLRKGQEPMPLRLMTKPEPLDEEMFQYYRKRIYEVVYKCSVEPWQ